MGGDTLSTAMEPEEDVPLLLKRTIAVYEAGRCLIAYMTPQYEDISKVCTLPYLKPCFSQYTASNDHIGMSGWLWLSQLLCGTVSLEAQQLKSCSHPQILH